MVGRHMPASNFVHSFIHVVPLSLVGHTKLYNKYRNDFFMLHFSLTAFLFSLTLALSLAVFGFIVSRFAAQFYRATLFWKKSRYFSSVFFFFLQSACRHSSHVLFVKFCCCSVLISGNSSSSH